MRNSSIPLVLLLVVIAAEMGAARPLTAAPLRQEPADTITAYQLANGWFSRDKSYHLAVSGVGAAALYAGGREIGIGRWPAAIGASVVMGTIGFLREAYADDEPDHLSRKAFSRKDMVWNGVGIVLGISVVDIVGQRRWRSSAASTGKPVDPPPIGSDTR